jgi:hypothetical protein
MEVIEMLDKVSELIIAKIDKYEVIIHHDMLSRDELVGMNARICELKELFTEIKNLEEEP